MRRIRAASALFGLMSALAACAGDAVSDAGAGEAVTTQYDDVAGVKVVEPRNATLHLWVSNQSFTDDPVVVTVSIDGVQLIDQPFDVEGQHNWVLFPIEVAPGRHLVTVESGTGAQLERQFTLPDDGRRYAVIDYWNYPRDGGKHFTWRIQLTPVAFM